MLRMSNFSVDLWLLYKSPDLVDLRASVNGAGVSRFLEPLQWGWFRLSFFSFFFWGGGRRVNVDCPILVTRHFTTRVHPTVPLHLLEYFSCSPIFELNSVAEHLWIFFSGAKQNPSIFLGSKGKSLLKMWLWIKKPVPKWNPGKWKHGPKPAKPLLFNLEPQPCVGWLFAQGPKKNAPQAAPAQRWRPVPKSSKAAQCLDAVHGRRAKGRWAKGCYPPTPPSIC